MPEGSFAILSETAHWPRPKEAPTEEQFIALCQKAIQEEKAWVVASAKIGGLTLDQTPADLAAEEHRLSMISVDSFNKVMGIKATTPVMLKAKAAAILETYYDEPLDHLDLWSLTQDAAALSLAASETDGKLPAADANIVDLAQKFRALETEILQHEADQEQSGRGSVKGQRIEQKIRRLTARKMDIRRRMVDLHPSTAKGIAAKAWLACWEACDGDMNGAPSEGSGVAVAWSLAKDIINGAPIPMPPQKAVSPDAELIGLCREYSNLWTQIRAVYDGPDGIEDDAACDAAVDPIHKAADALMPQLMAMKATTLEGHAARFSALMSLEPSRLQIDDLLDSPITSEKLLGMFLRDLAVQAKEFGL